MKHKSTDVVVTRPDEEGDFFRSGAQKVDLFFSFSGGIILEGNLPALELALDGTRVLIRPPIRLGHPSFRANPQINESNIDQFVSGLGSNSPLQMAAQPAPTTDDGASISYWLGRSENGKLAPNSPQPPADTIIVSVFADGAGLEQKIAKYVMEPLLEGVRIETRQWWAGRSYEGVAGKLHFLMPIEEGGQLAGQPSPICRIVTASDGMTPLDPALWIKASEYIKFQRLNAPRSLELNAYHAFASEERTSACVLACAAIESARDHILEKNGKKKSDLKTSDTDLLKHLSTGMNNVFERNYEIEEPIGFANLKSLWIARGDAAHGRLAYWRHGETQLQLQDLELPIFVSAVSSAMRWIFSL